MSSNLIIAAFVIEMFTLSAASQERRPEILTPSQPAFTAGRSKLPEDEPPHVAMVAASAENAHVLSDMVAPPPVIPQGPHALHTIVETDISRKSAVPAEPTPFHAGETVLVTMPFSSLQLNPSLVEYLGVNLTQVRSIQSLMDQERVRTEPLMLELRIVAAEQGVAIRQSQNTDNEGPAQTLAAKQARLLKQLMRANSRLQRKIDAVLDSQQRKKLDTFKRLDEVTVGERD
jgi:hypothetical protein